MSALRALVENPIKENFYGKRKKAINVLTAFFISHKSDPIYIYIGSLLYIGSLSFSLA